MKGIETPTRGKHMLRVGCYKLCRRWGTVKLQDQEMVMLGIPSGGRQQPCARKMEESRKKLHLENPYKDGHWNNELLDLGQGYMVSSEILSYNFLKLVSPFSSPVPEL